MVPVQGGATSPSSLRTIAFHLPQFHPIPQNDEWWGAGFTEWTNLAKARSLFRGHHQPLLPGELGFYDLRLQETRHAQAALAQQHGVSAFCYWHYWFAGRRLLADPVDALLAPGEPDLLFCLAWANQTWTGIWHGAPGRVLMEQTYPGMADEQAHFAAVLPFFRDPRYLCIDGRPLFYVFRPEQIPDVAGWCELWQRMAREAGLPRLYLIAEVSDLLGRGPVWNDVEVSGFDAGVYVRIPVSDTPADVLRMRLRRKLRGGPEVYPVTARLPTPPADCVQHLPCVYPNWDNTPRSGKRGVVLTGTSPAVFEAHLGDGLQRLTGRPPQEQLLFIKSWNEWAEGNHLEPDAVHGRAWLQALRRQVQA